MGGWVRAPHYAPLAVQTLSWAAARLPDGALLHPSGEEEIYDDVESVELLRRDRSFPPPPAFRPPAHLHPKGGGGTAGGCGAGGSGCPEGWRAASEAGDISLVSGTQMAPEGRGHTGGHGKWCSQPPPPRDALSMLGFTGGGAAQTPSTVALLVAAQR